MAPPATAAHRGTDMTASTADCAKHVRAGRFRKAEQFHDAAQGVLALADDNDDVNDAFVTRHFVRHQLHLTLIFGRHNMSVMVVGVAQVAAELGVSAARVRALIATGALPATKISGSYVLDQDAVDLLAQRERPAHVRAFSVRMAWACAAATDGVRPTWISDAELSRLRRRLDIAPASPGLWQARLAALTRSRQLFRVGPEQLAGLLLDRRVARTGTSAVVNGSDPRVGPGPAAVWVRTPDDLDELGHTYGLLPAAAGNLTVSVAGAPQVPWLGGPDGNAFRLVVAVDLLVQADARSHRTGSELLSAALAERSWRSLRPGPP